MRGSWSAAILVGGQARRLDGRAKPRLAVGGRAILERQLDVLTALGCTPTLITPAPEAYADRGLPVTADAVAAGALGALYTAVAAARTEWVLVLAGDMPFLTAPFLRHLLSVREDWDAVVPRTGGRWHPLCAIYAARVAPEIRAAIDRGVRRVGEVVETRRVRAVEDRDVAALDPSGRVLTNVNTADDLARARADASHER